MKGFFFSSPNPPSSHWLCREGKDQPENVGHFPYIVKRISLMNKAVKQDLAGPVKRNSGLMMLTVLLWNYEAGSFHITSEINVT